MPVLETATRLMRLVACVWIAAACCLSVKIVAQTEEDETLRQMHEAAEARKNGDLAAAADLYLQVTARSPDFFEAHLFLADTLKKLRKLAGAEEEFQIAKRIRPSHPLPHAALSDLKREAFRFQEAIDILNQAEQEVDLAKRGPLIRARGITYRQAGDFSAAIQVLEEGVAAYPGSHRIQRALARSYEAAGRWDEAVQAWEVAQGLSSKDAMTQLSLRQAQSFRNRLLEAEQSVQGPEPEPMGWADLAELRFLARQFKPAAEAAQMALQARPGRSDVTLLRALALAEIGRTAESLRGLEEISQEAPEWLLGSYHRAYLSRLKGDFAAEEKIWWEVMKRYPRDLGAQTVLVLNWKHRDLLKSRLRNLRKEQKRDGRLFLRVLEGMALEEAGHVEEAAAVWSDRFKAASQDPDAAGRLAEFFAFRPALLEQWIEGRDQQHARDASQWSLEDHLLLGQLQLIAGQGDRALAEAAEILERFPIQSVSHLFFATTLEATGGEYEKIISALDRAAALEPRSIWIHLQIGLVRLQAGDMEEAIRAGREVIRLAPGLPEGYQLLGSALIAAGDRTAAVEPLSRAVLLDPSDAPGTIRFQLSLALAASGHHLQARRALEGNVPPFPELTYRLAWSFAGRSFLDRSFRGVDWLAWRDRVQDPREDINHVYAVVEEMLRSLRDPYTRLRGIEETEAGFLAARSEKLELDRSGAPSPASRSVIPQELEDNFGYIRLTNLSDPSARAAIRRAIQEMAEEEGLILDLRGNVGGLTADADAIAGLLLEPGEVIGRERTRTGERVRRSTDRRPLLTKTPLIILTDKRTGSAAEKLAAGLQRAGRATVVGESSWGKGVGQVSRLLPGGAVVLVTAVENLTAAGEAIQGEGVTPDVEGEDASLEKAKEILRKKTKERNPPSP